MMTADPVECGHLSYDDWLTPCELVAGHLCMHAARNALGPRREKAWAQYPAKTSDNGISYGVMKPTYLQGPPLEASWPWFS